VSSFQQIMPEAHAFWNMPSKGNVVEATHPLVVMWVRKNA